MRPLEARSVARRDYPVRCIVKNKETGRFLGRRGCWTKSLNQAEQFPNGLSVSLHLEALKGDFEIIPLEK